VALNLLDDVFRLHFALETAKGILKGLAFLHTNLCHLDTPPNLPAGEVLEYDSGPGFPQKYSLRPTTVRVSSNYRKPTFLLVNFARSGLQSIAWSQGLRTVRATWH
jgi:hypothetical protein